MLLSCDFLRERNGEAIALKKEPTMDVDERGFGVAYGSGECVGLSALDCTGVPVMRSCVEKSRDLLVKGVSEAAAGV